MDAHLPDNNNLVQGSVQQNNQYNVSIVVWILF